MVVMTEARSLSGEALRLGGFVRIDLRRVATLARGMSRALFVGPQPCLTEHSSLAGLYMMVSKENLEK